MKRERSQITLELDQTPENLAFILKAKAQAEKPIEGIAHETELLYLEDNKMALFYKDGYSPVQTKYDYSKSEGVSVRKKCGTREGTDCYYEGQYSLLRR